MFSEDTIITPLNFNADIFKKSYLDKKLGVELRLGLVDSLPAHALHYVEKYRGIALSIEEKGIGQGLLDLECQKFADACKTQHLDILITKNDFPMDNRWFWLGDLGSLFSLARADRILCPLSPFLYDELYFDIKNVQEKI